MAPFTRHVGVSPHTTNLAARCSWHTRWHDTKLKCSTKLNQPHHRYGAGAGLPDSLPGGSAAPPEPGTSEPGSEPALDGGWLAGGHGTWNLGTSEPRLEAKSFETRLWRASKIYIYDLDLEPGPKNLDSGTSVTTYDHHRRHRPRKTWNLEPGTWNLEPGTLGTPHRVNDNPQSPQ